MGAKRKRISIVLSEPILDESKGEARSARSRKQRVIEDDDEDGDEWEGGEEAPLARRFPKSSSDPLPSSVSQRGRVRKPTEIMRQNWLQNRRKLTSFKSNY